MTTKKTLSLLSVLLIQAIVPTTILPAMADVDVEVPKPPTPDIGKVGRSPEPPATETPNNSDADSEKSIEPSSPAITLLENGADPTIPGAGGNTPLHAAARKGLTSVVLRILENPQVNVDAQNDEHETALTLATQYYKRPNAQGYYETIRTLLEHNANPNIPGPGGNAPLHYAAEQGLVGVINKLFKHNAYVNACNDAGQPALFLLIKTEPDLIKPKHHHTSTCEPIPENKAVMEWRTRFNPATLCNKPDHTFELIVNHKDIDLNIQDHQGETALHKAARANKYDMVEMLLKKKANPTLQNRDGKKPSEVTQDHEIKSMLQTAEKKYGRRFSLPW